MALSPKRELPEEWKGIVPTEVFLQEAEAIVREADRKNLTLRIMGGLGAAIHCQEYRDFARKLGRVGTGAVEGQEYSDLDFMSYKKHRDKIKAFFGELRYAKRKATLSSAASERQIYYHPKNWFYVDVFFDSLKVANHPLDFAGRLELDHPTISVTDMLLEKIQMWEAFSAKDLKDCLILLKAHSVEEKPGKEFLDVSYIARLLSQDWGFWYTATTNLKKIQKFVIDLDKLGGEAAIDPKSIEQADRYDITRKVEKLLERIDGEPKPLAWKMRAKLGTKKMWYTPVERSDTVGGFRIWEATLREDR